MAEQIGLKAIMDMNDFNRGVDRYISEVDRMNNHTKNFATSVMADYSKLGGAVVLATAAIGTAIASVVAFGAKELVDWTVGGIEAAIDFEQQMADIGSVLQATREEVQPLADLIDELALDPMLVVSADEASAAVEQLARNGLTMADIMGGAAEATILLANSTGGDFGKAADVATMAMQQFNLTAADMGRVADISQGVINHTRMELGDWALALGNSGGAANSFNVSLEDTATALAATLPMYHSARQAGTGLTNFLLRMVPITETSADQMRDLGLFSGLTGKAFDKLGGDIEKTEAKIVALDPASKNYQRDLDALTKTLTEQRMELNAGNNAFFDQQGNFVGLTEASRVLAEATRNLSVEKKAEAFRIIFGNDALETAIGLAEMGGEAFGELRNDLVQYGSAAESAAVRTNTLSARWENLGDIWDTIQRKSGAGFEPMLRNIVDWLIELTGENSDRVIAFFEQLALNIEEVFNATKPWLEEQIPKLLDNLFALANYLLELVKSGDAWNEHLDEMSPGLRGFIENIIYAIDWLIDFKDKVVLAYTEVKNFLQPIIDWIAKNVELEDVIAMVEGAIVTFLLPLGVMLLRMAAVGTAISLVIGFFRDLDVSVQDVVDGGVTALNTSLTDLFPNLETTGSSLDQWIAKNVTLQDGLVALGAAILILNAGPILAFAVAVANLALIVGLLTPVIAAVRVAWEEDWAGMRTFFEETWSKLEIPVNDFINNILSGQWVLAWEGAKVIVGIALDEINRGLDQISTWFQTTFPNTAAIWGNIWKGMAGNSEDALRGTSEILMSLEDRIKLLDLHISNIGLRYQINFNPFDNQEFVDQLEINNKEIERIETDHAYYLKSLREMAINDQIFALKSKVKDFGEIGVNIASALDTGVYQSLDAIGRMDMILAEVKKSMTQGFYDIEVLKEKIGFFDFGVGFGKDKSVEKFTTQIQILATAIKAGMMDAGSEAVEAYIEGLSEKLGLAESTSKMVAYKIIEAISGQDKNYRSAGEKSTEAYAQGVGSPAAIGEISNAWQAVFDFADKFGVELPPEMYAAGLASATQVGAGVTAGTPTAIDAYSYVMEQAKLKIGTLPDEMEKTGKDSTDGLTKGVIDGGFNPIAAIQAILDAMSGAGATLPPELAMYGTQATQALATSVGNGGFEAITSTQVMIDRMVEAGAFLTPGLTNVANMSMQEFGKHLGIQAEVPITTLQEVIRLMLNEGLTLPPEFALLGSRSMMEMGTGVQGAAQIPLDQYNAVVEAAKAAGIELPPEYLAYGQGSVENLGTGASEKKDEAVGIFAGVRDSAYEESKQLIGMMNSVGKAAIVELGFGVTEVAPAEIGAAFGSASGGSAPSSVFGVIDTKVKEMLEILNTAGQLGMGSLNVGITDAAPAQIGSAFGSKTGTESGTVLGEMNIKLADMLSQLNDRGIAGMAELAAGIISGSPVVVGSFTTMSSQILAVIDTMISQIVAKFAGLSGQVTSAVNVDAFRSIGENIGNSFISGVDSKIGDAKNKVQELVNLSAEAAEAAAQIASPSRVFMRIGEQSGEGYIVGWQNMSEKALQYMVNFANLVEYQLSRVTKSMNMAGGGSMDMSGMSSQSTVNALNLLQHRLSEAIPANNMMATSSPTVNNYRTNQISPNFGPISVSDERSAHQFVQMVRKVMDDYVQ